MLPSPLCGLFDEACAWFERFRADLAAHGLDIGPETTVRRGEGMLCRYDRDDGAICLSLPDPADPLGRFTAAVFQSVLHCDDEADLADLVRLLLPMLIAHELGHLLRDRHGLFGDDLWFEEQVANRMAVALSRPAMSAAQRERLVLKIRRTLHHLAPTVGSEHIAVASYLDPLEAFAASGLLAPAAVRSLQLMQRLLRVSPEHLLRGLPQASHAVLERYAERRGTIEGFNEDYASGLARYVYFQFGWLLIQLESPEHCYVDEVARQHLGHGSVLLPRLVANVAGPAVAAIRACFAAHRLVADESPALSRYFLKRYRSLLLDHVIATQSGGMAASALADGSTRRLLDAQIDDDAGALDLLAVVAPPESRSLFPGALGARSCMPEGFHTETDRRLWACLRGADDPAAATTLARLTQLDASEVYRSLPAELCLEMVHAMAEVHLPAGATLIEQGSPNDDVFIVTRGEFDVLVGEPGAERRLAAMRPGEVVGDMAFLTGEPRSATLRATAPSTCLVLRAVDLKRLAFEHPTVLMRMARVIVRRLAERSPAGSTRRPSTRLATV
jgi:hypothetical protein